ncbi:Modulator of FtsH protease HflK [Candidatus Bealeia paramacronuclearis]|uniref:Protein HflK n=1 Tax=Candidatus Bealeia paramacronuclearis TaxID=1921001 RepID=A0ABZ2C574_9PROT|nr:Modulator of FtsH protease HflK [Candidatus Bealeia paramacronuclearis]
MAWDENGGPWGNNNDDKNPWQRKPGGGKSTPPDFEKWFKDQKKKFKKMSGGPGPNKNLLWLVAGGVFILWLLTGVYQVQNDQQAAILKFGKWDRTTDPGLHYHLPLPIETAVIRNVTTINVFTNTTLNSENAGDGSLMLTGDENIADVQFAVYWQINNLENFLFSAKSPEATVKAAADSVFREVIAQTPIAQALSEGRSDINIKVKERLQKVIDEYKLGVTITQVKLLKVTPPTAEVVDAYLDVQRAKADMERKRNEAEFYHNSIVPVARGEAQKIIQDAEAYKSQIVADAQGDTQRFLSVLTQYRKAPEITKKRLYLKTMQTILQGANKLVTNGDTGKQSVLPYLPLPELKTKPIPETASTEEVKK